MVPELDSSQTAVPPRSNPPVPPAVARPPVSLSGSRTMFTIWGRRQKYCDGISRRNFLRVGAFGAGLTLADVLRARAAGAAQGQRPASHKAAIMIYLPGGPSHMDMYDLKPD